MILGNDTQLILCCQVSTEPKPDIPDFSIQWHYSSIFPKIINKTSDTAVDYGQIHMNNTATFSRKTVWSKLTVDFKLGHTEGYYWCSVNINDTFYPSGVLNISTVAEIRLQACTCGDGPVTDNTQFSKFLCANSDFKKISDTCPHGDTGETTQATSVANDLRTTIPYDIGKNNTTTTHEVTESSTTSSTEVSTNNNSTNHHTSMEITTETSNNNKSTTHHIDMQITTENSYEDITQATNVADTEGLTTAETLEKDQLDRIMMSFTIGKLPFKNDEYVHVYCLVFYSQVSVLVLYCP